MGYSFMRIKNGDQCFHFIAVTLLLMAWEEPGASEETLVVVTLVQGSLSHGGSGSADGAHLHLGVQWRPLYQRQQVSGQTGRQRLRQRTQCRHLPHHPGGENTNYRL